MVLVIVALASASAYLTRYCISAANTTIQSELNFDDTEMGRLMGGFALGYLVCQVPAGWIGNRWGTRLTFAVLSVLWSLSNLWSALVSGLHSMWASRLFLGIFQAGLTPLSAKILSDWMPLKWRGFSSALMTAAMSVGGAFALWLTGWLLARHVDWRTIFVVYSGVGIVWAIGYYAYFRNHPREHAGVNQAELNMIRSAAELDTDARQLPAAVLETEALPVAERSLVLGMLANPSMWGICIQSFFRAAGYAFFVTWFFAFLEYVYGVDKASAGMLNSLPLIAVVVGSLAGGVVVDRLLKSTGSKWISRSGTAIVALALSGVLTMASAWTASAAQLSVVIALGALFSGLGSPAAWAATIDIGGRHTAVVMGTMNMAGGLAGVVLPVLLGSWFQQIRESDGNWDLVIYLHAGFYFAGALSWLLVDPNRELD